LHPLVKVSVRNSQVVRSSGNGLIAGIQYRRFTLSVSHNIVSNNDSGIVAIAAGARVWASGNTVSDNGTASTTTAATL